MKLHKIATVIALGTIGLLSAEDKIMQLPEISKAGGMPIMEALAQRKSTRAYDRTRQVQDKTLAELLWAAWGFNRDGKRTAPTALNRQELELYVLKADGCWLYDAAKNALVQKGSEDLRKVAAGSLGSQAFVLDAPVTLVYVANTALSQGMNNYVYMDAGFAAQNAYLYCASAGLGSVVRGSFPENMGKAMKLPAGRTVLLCQCIGYPAEQ